MQSAQVERDQAQKQLLLITAQEKKDEEMINLKLRETNKELEKDHKVKEFIQQKLQLQSELLQSYEDARLEEEQKVEVNRRRNQNYEEWREQTKIVNEKEMKEYQKVIDRVVSQIEGKQLKQYTQDESGLKLKLQDQI